jgi:hypothetical protein
MKKILAAMLLISTGLEAQVGVGTNSPNASAILDVTSNTRGLLAPRMTAAQRLAIASPATGLMVYQTDIQGNTPSNTPGYYVYNGTTWHRMALASEVAATANSWTVSNTHQYSNVAGNVGIGTTNPTQKLHIVGNALHEGGSWTINDASGLIQFQNAGASKAYVQLSGDNLRMGTSSGNTLGKLIVRNNGTDRVMIDSSGNVQIVGQLGASLTTPGFLTLGQLTGTNLIFDTNEMLARNNGVSSTLYLQRPGGFVAIGDTDPKEKLDVNGNIYLSGTTTRRIKFETPSTGIGSRKPGLMFQRPDGTELGRIEYVDTANFTNYIRIGIGNTGSNDLIVRDNKVSVGSLLPLAKFHIQGEAGEDELSIKGAIGETGTIQFYKQPAGSSAEKKGFVQLDGDDLRLGTNSGNVNGSFVIRTNGADRMFVDESGNVSIGTAQTAVGYKLNVGGNIICEEMKVQLMGAWPDYVFEDNYHLRNLESLDSYIRANKHLPGIPAAKEVAEQGIGVGQMQKQLVEKIEELTLYIIQLNKELNELKAKNR